MALQASLALIDTHCHLNFNVFDPDRRAVVERARENGVTRIVIPAVDLKTSRLALSWAQEFADTFAAVGIHPNDGASWTKASLSEIKAMATEDKVVAIGEIGLDYYRNTTPRSLQIEILTQQLGLAAELCLPVIIHNRQAADDLGRILREWHRNLVEDHSPVKDAPGVLHSFSGNDGFAREMTSLNFKLGINGPLTFHNSLALQALVASLPLEVILVETDAPFLAPHPLRGTRNEPANVRIVAEKISQLKGISLEHVAEVTTSGAERLFTWRETR